MRKLLVLATISATIAAVNPALAFVNLGLGTSDELAHGGGCRKSSPAGQCCHLEKATGIVHCH